MTNSTQFKTVAVFAALLAVSATQPVAADSTTFSASNRIEVPIADLNLAHAAGLNVLYQRLSSASREVCGSTADLKSAGSIKQLRVNKACYEQTLASALAEVNFPTASQARTQ